MTLSATEYTRLRDLTGGRTNTKDRDHLTDAELQAEYDAAGSWDVATVYVLQRRIAMCSAYVDKAHDVNSISLSQKVKHMRDLLKDARDAAGLTGFTIQTGALDTSLDKETTLTDYIDC